MPNYQTATLLASSGDVYTQLMDILKTYMEARGWTTNLYEDYRWYYWGTAYTSKRLHAQKSIGGTNRFINIRSQKDQRIFTWSNIKRFNGLGAIASTGYTAATQTLTITNYTSIDGGASIRVSAPGVNATIGDSVTIAGSGEASYNGIQTIIAGDHATVESDVTVGTFVDINIPFVTNPATKGTIEGPSVWDDMPEATGLQDPNVNSSSRNGCGALDLPEDVLTYFLFSDTGGDNIYLVCGNSTGYTGLCFGVTSLGNYFLAGSSHQTNSPSIQSNLLLTEGGFGTMVVRKIDDSEWFPYASAFSNNAVVIPAKDFTNTDIFESWSMVQELLFCSPDNFKGNNPLIPSYINQITGTVAPYDQVFLGTIPGIKYVNMKNMDSLTELTFGGDVYKLFRLYGADDVNDATLGLALLK